jgi:hypothetical protein
MSGLNALLTTTVSTMTVTSNATKDGQIMLLDAYIHTCVRTHGRIYKQFTDISPCVLT